MSGRAPLPIDAVLPDLITALRTKGQAVLQAPPGAGKTTRVPIAILEAGLAPGRIVMLEPRRVAARAAAERLAQELGEPLGRRVGYRIRGDAVAGSAVEVVTEGILTRMLQSDAALPGTGCVIFDEFHERALQADLGLALALEVRAALRPDLLLVVMSATLDAGPVAALMGGAPVVTAEGRSFLVETLWLDHSRAPGRLEAATAALALRALEETDGGVLVFLPGQREIARTAAVLGANLATVVTLQPLHGGLPLAAQRAAIAPIAHGRKLVLATAIAETSLTIPDVRAVVDAGLARRARFDPGSGMTRLVTERVSRAEADQRRGRAGRTAPGRCYRLWTRGEEGGLAPFAPPEIAAADLAGLALDLAQWGAADAARLAFLTPPPEAALAEARALLTDLGALADGRITGHGRALARLPLHPRLGHMLLVAAQQGAGGLAADLAALLQVRDTSSRSRETGTVDVALRLARLRDPDQASVRAEAQRLRALAPRGSGEGLSPGAVLSLAYPDRIAQRRAGPAPRYLLSGGKGAVLPEGDLLGAAGLLVAADLDGDPREARIRSAAAVDEADVRALQSGLIRSERVCAWSRREGRVTARIQLRLGALVLEDRPWTDAPPEAVEAAVLEGIRALGLESLPWTPAARRLRDRVEWLRASGEDLPNFSLESLEDALETWLAPFLAGVTRTEDFARLDLAAALEVYLGRSARLVLDRLAPPEITAPTGTRLPIDYADATGAPRVAVRLQEMFGLTHHPCVGPRRIPLVIELLSPARRPVQTTADLPGFWTQGYAEVRRDLRGRYPRHAWPEDPVAAPPTRGVKPRKP